jgi:colicin import membrane protein
MNRWIAGSAAALVSIALHALFVGGVLLTESGHGFSSRARAGANSAASEEEAITLMLIDDPGSAAADDEPMPDAESDLADAAHASSEDLIPDREEHATLFGRYLAQIQARVERAWLRPRTPIGAERFECHLQLAQNAHGEVMETTLERCNGDVRWQLSLVNALERASPLPAPPDPNVFAESLQLSFHATAFVPGADEEEFELPGTPVIQ